jgi:hypothetical protein
MTSQVNYLLSPTAIRERCQQVYDFNVEGRGSFILNFDKWETVINYVLKTIESNYPTLNIPFHSRLGHFRAGGVDRLVWSELDMQTLSPIEKVKRLVDLVILSVLLDAGAGDDWKFNEEKTGQTITRSEGLGVASYYMFVGGGLSSQKKIETDAQGLLSLTEKDIIKAFQVSEKNPLVGVQGRLNLLKSLGRVIQSQPEVFPNQRPSDLVERFKLNAQVDALLVLRTLLIHLGEIWPSRIVLDGAPLGDTWSLPLLGPKNSFESLVPFHKLSQWLSYSLLDCCVQAGLPVINVEKLTGLPEYRNGGLFLDLGLIEFRDPNFLTCGLSAEMPETIEWRALTVILLDHLAEKIQKKLGQKPQDFPLAKVLEGGSWWAGRRIAAEKRPGGVPPLKIISDGTVF